MSRPFRLLLLITAALAVPVIPFLVLGSQFEDTLTRWTQQGWSHSTLFWVVVAVLGADILLPVPSSAVNTYAGAQLGIAWGATAALTGMTLGSCLGFFISRWIGPRVLRWLAHPADIQRLQNVQEQWNIWLLILTRPVPILAEACVVLLGSLHMKWRTFFPITFLAHGVMALLYACLGAWAASRQYLPWALIGSLVLPLLLTFTVRRLLPTKTAPALTKAASDEP